MRLVNYHNNQQVSSPQSSNPNQSHPAPHLLSSTMEGTHQLCSSYGFQILGRAHTHFPCPDTFLPSNSGMAFRPSLCSWCPCKLWNGCNLDPHSGNTRLAFLHCPDRLKWKWCQVTFLRPRVWQSAEMSFSKKLTDRPKQQCVMLHFQILTRFCWIKMFDSFAYLALSNCVSASLC